VQVSGRECINYYPTPLVRPTPRHLEPGRSLDFRSRSALYPPHLSAEHGERVPISGLLVPHVPSLNLARVTRQARSPDMEAAALSAHEAYCCLYAPWLRVTPVSRTEGLCRSPRQHLGRRPAECVLLPGPLCKAIDIAVSNIKGRWRVQICVCQIGATARLNGELHRRSGRSGGFVFLLLQSPHLGFCSGPKAS
jgi:hypothetical protein